jgi:hypothetical protein
MPGEEPLPPLTRRPPPACGKKRGGFFVYLLCTKCAYPPHALRVTRHSFSRMRTADFKTKYPVQQTAGQARLHGEPLTIHPLLLTIQKVLRAFFYETFYL